MKRILCIVTAIIIVTFTFSGCGNKADESAVVPQASSAVATPKPTENADSKEQSAEKEQSAVTDVRIGFIMQEYNGDDIVEIPYFEYEGERNDALESINRAYNQGDVRVYEEFIANRNEGEWIEIRAYPFTSDKYLQVISTVCTFPVYGTSGYAFSVNYDIPNNEWITVSQAMEREGIDDDTIRADVEVLFVPEFDGQTFSDIKPAAFLIREDDSGEFTQFILEITTLNTDGDEWISFFSYTPKYQQLVMLNGLCLFDPSELDQMQPPLAYRRSEDNPDYSVNADDDGIATEPQLGGEYIAPGVIYTGSVLEGDSGDYISAYEAAVGLYYRALTSIYDWNTDYDEFFNPIYISVVGEESDDIPSYIIDVMCNGNTSRFIVSYQGDIKQVGDGLGVRSWGNISEADEWYKYLGFWYSDNNDCYIFKINGTFKYMAGDEINPNRVLELVGEWNATDNKLQLNVALSIVAPSGPVDKIEESDNIQVQEDGSVLMTYSPPEAEFHDVIYLGVDDDTGLEMISIDGVSFTKSTTPLFINGE